MTGHLDLRYDRYEARLRIPHDLGDLLLGIEAAVRLPVEPPLGRVGVGAPDDRLPPPRAQRGEPWVLADLDTPPLVVGEVQVQPVQLMERDEIDELLHELLGPEVARHDQVHATPAEPRSA